MKTMRKNKKIKIKGTKMKDVFHRVISRPATKKKKSVNIKIGQQQCPKLKYKENKNLNIKQYIQENWHNIKSANNQN